MLRKIMSKLCLVAFLGLFNVGAFAHLPNTFHQIYFFGDSLTDLANGPEAPVTNRESGPIYPGKYTWAKFFGEKYYGISVTPSKDGGNDYAISAEKSQDFIRDEIDKFLDKHNPAKEDPANTLYVIWIGPNDFLHMDKPNPDLHDIELIVMRGISNTAAGIDKLYYAGARNFLVIGLPDIAYTPEVIRAGGLKFLEVMQACEGWNDALFNLDTTKSAPIAGLKKLHPDMHIYYYNIFANPDHDLLRDVAEAPEDFGFPPQLLYRGAMQNNNISEWAEALKYLSTSDNNPDNYSFFNGVHPTTHTSYIMAQYTYDNAREF